MTGDDRAHKTMQDRRGGRLRYRWGMPKHKPHPIRHLLLAVIALLAVSLRGTPTATAANGSWEWGPPGFSAAWTPGQRLDYIVQYGIADPAANYWTPFWSGAGASNVWTGVADTGPRNTFAVNHDINARYGIPVLGYLDVVTPLFGTNHLEIAATVTQVWNDIVDFVSGVWDAITGWFESVFDSYESTGGYDDWGGGWEGGWDSGGWDNGFDGGYGGYSYGGL